MAACSEITLRVNPKRIYFVKFILEGYDGLTLVSTIDPKKGLIKICFPEEVRAEVEHLLKDLAPKIGSS